MKYLCIVAVAVALTAVCAVRDVSAHNNCIKWNKCNAECDTIGESSCRRSNGRLWEIPCYGPACAPVGFAADVVFILDSSNSIGERTWYKARQFVIDVANHLPVNNNDVEIGLVLFAGSASNKDLGDLSSAGEMEKHLMSLPPTSGHSNAASGFQSAVDVFDAGTRKVKKIAIFVSDGKFRNQAEPSVEAAQDLKDSGVEVFGVAVGDWSEVKMRSIASPPGSQFAQHIETPEALRAVINAIVEEASKPKCDGKKKPIDELRVELLKLQLNGERDKAELVAATLELARAELVLANANRELVSAQLVLVNAELQETNLEIDQLETEAAATVAPCTAAPATAAPPTAAPPTAVFATPAPTTAAPTTAAPPTAAPTTTAPTTAAPTTAAPTTTTTPATTTIDTSPTSSKYATTQPSE